MCGEEFAESARSSACGLFRKVSPVTGSAPASYIYLFYSVADDDYWPDKAVDKEVKRLPVTCANKGCQWRGNLETFLKVFAELYIFHFFTFSSLFLEEHQHLCDEVTTLKREKKVLQEELYAYKQQAAEGSTVKEFSSLSGPHEVGY